MNTRQQLDTTSHLDGVTARYHHLLIRSQPGLEIIINTMPSMAIVLNHSRQIVYANKSFLDASQHAKGEKEPISEYSIGDLDPLWGNLMGLQIGEALGCIQAERSNLKCGMTASCKHCGIWQAITLCMDENKTAPLISRINQGKTSSRNDRSLLLNVSVSPLKILQWDFLLVVLTDISSDVSCKMMEHVLFHDIRDITNSIMLIANMLKEKNVTRPEDVQLIYQVLSSKATQASDELTAHRTLIQAERGQLNVHPVPLDSFDLLKTAISAFEKSQHGSGTPVLTDPSSKTISFTTDKNLLELILRNMLFSAAETADPDAPITAGCHRKNNGIEFYVRNKSVLHKDSQAKLFTRTFTAKDTKLGIDTYAMKRIGESYLNGEVSCTSNPDNGTIFIIHLPIEN